MRQRLQRFMYGRYGVDQYSKFLMILTIIICVLNFFLNHIFLNSLTFVLIIYVYYRMFSRNIAKRYAENMKYLNVKNRITGKFKKQQWMIKQRKTHHIYKCPTCNQKIRIPRGKGRICITCPKCKTEFTKTS